MLTRKTSLLATLLLAAGTTAASADHDRVKDIDTDQWKQNRQIEDGRYSGNLTRREYRELLAEQERIKRMEAAARADGHITRREYRDIREAQQEAGRHIQAEANDGQVSFWRRWLYRSRY